MGLYGTCVLPHLINLAMKHPLAQQRRAKLVPQASGAVLEVGIGSGLNVPLYGPDATALCGVDPNERLLAMARRRAGEARVALVCGSAEELPLPAHSFDSVVLTWTLCSIGSPEKALAEIRRVLKPGGQLLFVEHGLAPDAGVRRWQKRLTPVWSRLAGGCRLDRPVDELIRAAGFRIERLASEYVPGPRPWTFFYQGKALAPGGPSAPA